MRSSFFILAPFLLSNLAWALPSHQTPFLAGSPQLLAPLLSAENAEPIDNSFIVVLKDKISPEELEAHHNFLLEVLTTHGGLVSDSADGSNELKHIYEMDGLKGYAGKFTESALEQLRRHPAVSFVERDQTVSASELQRNAPWGLSRLSHRESLTFRTYNKYPYDDRAGDGITAYVVDTGINIKHVDFDGRAIWGITVPEGDEDIDGNGHGTHVAGTIAGSRYGVSKKAKVVAVKVLRSNGSGTMSDVIRGVEYVAEAHQIAAQSSKKTASVANMSLGGGYSRALNMAVDGAVDAGVHFAVAAGNDDSDACGYSPASSQNAISVGASTIDDERAWFSNKGKCVDIFAPGKDITSTWIGSPTATNTISGTSMASPHVAGLLAYMLSLEDDPSSVTPKQMKERLADTGTKDVLSKVPKDTPNVLIFSNPPDDLAFSTDVAAMEALEEMEELLYLSLLEAELETMVEAALLSDMDQSSDDELDMFEFMAEDTSEEANNVDTDAVLISENVDQEEDGDQLLTLIEALLA